METYQPSLHRALLLSLPGSALLSVPVGLWTYDAFLRPLGIPFSISNKYEDWVFWALAPLAPVALVASSVAILECAKSEAWPFVRVGIMVLNLVADRFPDGLPSGA